MKIPQNKIDEVASTVDIVDVISGYTQLRKAGKNFMGRCPFHEERTPSFSVSQEKGVYHCFGCGKSGNIFTFLMDMEHITFFEAVKELAEKANIKLEFENEPYDADRNKIDILFEINKHAALIYHNNLKARSGEYAREYMNQRSISPEMITRFGIGYSLKEKDGLFKQLKEHFSLEDLTESGLFIDLGRDEIRDRFRGRLMFPIISEAGKVVGFGGRRIFEESSEEAKYINSPETKVYNKSRILYGLNLSKNPIKQNGFAVLVEGYLDLISLYQSGIENVIASSGTSLTGLHVKILSRYTDEIVILFDSDLAGQNASRRAIELMLENNIKATVIELPAGDDPDTFIRKNGKEKFDRLLQNRVGIIDYIAGRYKQQGRLGTPEGNTEFVREIIGLIAKMKDEIKRDFYIKDISQRFSIYETLIRKELNSYQKVKSRGKTDSEYKIKIKELNPEQSLQLNIPNNHYTLISILFYGDDKTREYLINNLEIELITNKKVLNIINYVINKIMKKDILSISSIFNDFPKNDENRILGQALLNENYVLSSNENYIEQAKAIIEQLRKTLKYENLYIKKS